MSVKLENEAKLRVNGSHLPSYQGKTVFLMGYVLQVDPSGMNVKLKGSDNQIVDIRMNEPMSGCAEGLVEIIGTVVGRNSISGYMDQIFSKEMSTPFDMIVYNEAVQLANKHPMFYPTMKESSGF